MSNTAAKNKVILEIIPRIREAMRSQRMEVRHIAEITGLKRYTITNVLMGETKRFDYITLIAAAVDIPIAINDDDKTILDFTFYISASAACLEALSGLKKECPKYIVEELIFKIYLYAKKSNISDKNTLKGYVYGLIEKEHNFSL